MKEYVRHHKDKILREINIDQQIATNLGISVDNFPMYRIFPITIYLSEGFNPHLVESKLKEFLAYSGFEVIDKSEVEYGSWFRSLLAKTLYKETINELKDGFDKAKKSLELKHLDKVQSEIELNQATAASALLSALGNDSSSTD